jgi:hypothetical protein
MSTEFKLVGYEVSSRSISCTGSDGWGKYFPCTEEEYDQYKAQPFSHGWQHHARKLYVEVESEHPDPELQWMATL